MTALNVLLTRLRENARTEREKGNYFEQVVKIYFQNEPYFKDLYNQVWLWEDWRQYWIKQGNPDPGADTGIDLVAKTDSANEYHAIQAKFYDADSTLYKGQIDSLYNLYVIQNR